MARSAAKTLNILALLASAVVAGGVVRGQDAAGGQSAASGQSLVTLEQAQSRTGRDFTAVFEGQTIRVRGQISASPVWALGPYYLPLRDNSDHGLILAGNEKVFTDLAPGDWIEAVGKIQSRGGLPLMTPASIQKTAPEAPPHPKDVSLSELSALRNLGLMRSDPDFRVGHAILCSAPLQSRLSGAVVIRRRRRDSGKRLVSAALAGIGSACRTGGAGGPLVGAGTPSEGAARILACLLWPERRSDRRIHA
jgi:hypothetical protein